MDGAILGGLTADPSDIIDASENLALLSGAAVLAAEGLWALEGGPRIASLQHLLQRVKADAEALATMARRQGAAVAPVTLRVAQ